MKERLVELLKNADMHICGRYANYDEAKEMSADYLLAAGVIVPPVKIGDTVYKVVSDKRVKHPYEYKVIGFWYSADERRSTVHLAMYICGVFVSSIIVPFDEIGKTVFLTKEEAEQALEEAQG